MARGRTVETMRGMVTTTSLLLGTGLTLSNLLLGIAVVLLAVRLSNARRDQPF
jgi:hypothetical protein